MKKTLNEDTLFLIFTVLLFIILIIVVIFLIQGTNKRDTILLEYEAERTANDFFDAYRANLNVESLIAQYGVISFGIYLSNGDAVKRYGNAPATLSGYNFHYGISNLKVFIDHKKKTFTIIRQSGMGAMMSQGMRGNIIGKKRMGTPYIVLLEIDAQNYEKRHTLFRYLTYIVPFIILTLLAVFIYLYKRSINFKEGMLKQQQLARLGEVSRTLMHEIKNPLGAIRIQTGYLKKILPEDTYKDIEIIEEEIQRINNLIERIGDFLRDPVGKPEKLCIETFIENLSKRFSANIKLVNKDKKEHFIIFDRERLRSILENLIKNAIESYPDISSEEKRVDIVTSSNRGKVVIRISDYGRGISGENIEKIYDPFFTTKIKGSGIGLSLTRRFIEAAGGNIFIKGNSEKGTDVVILLKEVREK